MVKEATKTFRCELCDKTFQTPQALSSHVTYKHGKAEAVQGTASGITAPLPPEISKDPKYIDVWKKLEIKRLQNHLRFESEIPKIVDLAERVARLEENWKELKTSEQTQDETLENLTDWVNQLMEDNERHKHNIADALFSIAMLRSPGGYGGLTTKALEDIKRDYRLVPKRDGPGFRSMRANEI